MVIYIQKQKYSDDYDFYYNFIPTVIQGLYVKYVSSLKAIESKMSEECLRRFNVSVPYILEHLHEYIKVTENKRDYIYYIDATKKIGDNKVSEILSFIDNGNLTTRGFNAFKYIDEDLKSHNYYNTLYLYNKLSTGGMRICL